MGVACRLYDRVENAYKVLVTKPERLLGSLGTNYKITLKRILKEQCGTVWAWLISLRTGTSECSKQPSSWLVGWLLQIMNLLIKKFSPASWIPPSQVQTFSLALCIQTPTIYVLPLMWMTKFLIHTENHIKETIIMSYI